MSFRSKVNIFTFIKYIKIPFYAYEKNSLKIFRGTQKVYNVSPPSVIIIRTPICNRLKHIFTNIIISRLNGLSSSILSFLRIPKVKNIARRKINTGFYTYTFYYFVNKF